LNTTNKSEKLEIIIPVYNEEKCIPELMNRLLGVRTSMSSAIDVSFIFTDDGSSDRSLDMLSQYADKYQFVKLISFSRNFGHQIALTAGIDYSNANYVAIIDADLQDPPELIEDMYKKAQEGFDVVYGKRLSREGETVFKKITAKLFYFLINKTSNVDISLATGDFRLMNKKVVDILKKIRERHRFIRGIVPWIGFKSAPIYYDRKKRIAGSTKIPFKKMLLFALDGIYSFSNSPLKLVSFIGFILFGLGLIIGILLLYLKMFTTIHIPIIMVTLLIIIIMGGVQIIMIGIIGEYLGRIFDESKKRPLYIVNERKNFIE